MEYLREMAEGGYRPDAIGPFHERMIPWLLESRGVPKDAPVLDVGAGQGHGLLPLARAGWRDLIALDRDPFNLERFREQHGFRVLRCDAERERFELADASVGAVLCLHLIEHLADPANLLGEVRRVLRPDGRLFLVTPDWRKQFKIFYRDPTHVRPYDAVALGRLLRMHGFDAELSPFGTALGLGRLQAYRWVPRLGLLGRDLLAVARPVAAGATAAA